MFTVLLLLGGIFRGIRQRKSLQNQVHKFGKGIILTLRPRDADEIAFIFGVRVKRLRKIAPQRITVRVEFAMRQLVCQSRYHWLQRGLF